MNNIKIVKNILSVKTSNYDRTRLVGELNESLFKLVDHMPFIISKGDCDKLIGTKRKLNPKKINISSGNSTDGGMAWVDVDMDGQQIYELYIDEKRFKDLKLTRYECIQLILIAVNTDRENIKYIKAKEFKTDIATTDYLLEIIK